MSVDAKIIHINFKPTFCDHVSKDMVHKRLECGWGIAKPKEHYSGFKESKGGDEHSLPLVCFMNADVVVSPMDVKLSEQGGVLHVVNEFQNERKGVRIPNSMGIQIAIILTRAKRAVFLGDKEEWCCLGGFGRDNTSSLEVFFNEGRAGFFFLGI